MALDMQIRAVHGFLRNVTFFALKQYSECTKHQPRVTYQEKVYQKALVCAMVRDREEQIRISRKPL